MTPTSSFFGLKARLTKFVFKLANDGHTLMYVILGDFALCSLAYGLIEHKGPIKSMWWAVVTGFTVGYGDYYPTTTAGRFVASFLMATFWLLTILAAAFITARVVLDQDEFSHDEQELIKAELAKTLANTEIIMERLGINAR